MNMTTNTSGNNGRLIYRAGIFVFALTVVSVIHFFGHSLGMSQNAVHAYGPLATIIIVSLSMLGYRFFSRGVSPSLIKQAVYTIIIFSVLSYLFLGHLHKQQAQSNPLPRNSIAATQYAQR